MEPPLGVEPSWRTYRASASLKMLWGVEFMICDLRFAIFWYPENGAGERSRTVVSALARPYSAVEPHPLEMVSPAGLSPATWSLGHSRSVL